MRSTPSVSDPCQDTARALNTALRNNDVSIDCAFEFCSPGVQQLECVEYERQPQTFTIYCHGCGHRFTLMNASRLWKAAVPYLHE